MFLIVYIEAREYNGKTGLVSLELIWSEEADAVNIAEGDLTIAQANTATVVKLNRGDAMCL